MTEVGAELGYRVEAAASKAARLGRTPDASWSSVVVDIEGAARARTSYEETRRGTLPGHASWLAERA